MLWGFRSQREIFESSRSIVRWNWHLCIAADVLCRLGVDCETCFIAESFKLLGACFHQTKFRDVPGSGVGEGDCSGLIGASWSKEEKRVWL